MKLGDAASADICLKCDGGASGGTAGDDWATNEWRGLPGDEVQAASSDVTYEGKALRPAESNCRRITRR